MRMMRKSRILWVLTLGLGLSACGGIGDGTRPTGIRIVPFNADLEATETTIYTCVRSALVLVAEFSDGSLGDFTSRAVWSSDDPGIVRVSNFDEPVEGTEDQFFGFGSLTPVSVGTTMIRADYFGLTAAFPVTVEAATDFRVESASVTLAPRSIQSFVVTANLGGVETDISNVIRFSLAQENDDAVTLDDTGFAIANAVGGPLDVNLQFNAPCDVQLQASLEVAEIQEVEISYEEGFGEELIIGTSQKIHALGRFANGATLNLDGQVVFNVDDGDDDTSNDPVSFSILSAFQPLANADNLGTAQVSATFGAIPEFGDEPAVEGVTSNTLPITVVDATLIDFEIAPLNPTVAPLDALQFTALGSFDTGVTQSITNSLLWSVNDPEVATIGNGVGAVSGQFQSQVDQEDVLTVTASAAINDVEISRATTVTVSDDPPANEGEENEPDPAS